MTDPKPVRWGIIGPGGIAKAFAANLPKSKTGRLVAIATRDPAKASLAEDFPGARIVAGPDALLADPEIDAVYIATPHPFHAEWAIRAAEAGKHVLCEKPMAVSRPQAEAMIHAARKAGTFLGEAFMNRSHPYTARMNGLIADGTIGEVRMIKADFGFAMATPDPAHRLLANETAGGAILDIACYPVSTARQIAGIANGKAFIDPVKVAGVAHIEPTGADGWASAVMEFPGGIVAEVSGSILLAQDNQVRVFGTTGWLEAKSPWFCTGRQGGEAEIVIHRPHWGDETITVQEPAWLYTFEIDAVGQAIAEGRQEFAPPAAGWADTLGNMDVLDKWRASIRLEYGFERGTESKTKIDGRPLNRSPEPMRRRKIAPLDREASVIGLGGANFETFTQAAILFDTFYERGGNLLDGAWIYGLGKADRLLGDWMAARGVRDDIILIGKGAHSPLCYPDAVGRQLAESLDRLKTDRIDLYFLHRDNPDVPVGEFVDAMDREAAAGRIVAFGGSNWSRERMDAAIAYARANGKREPSILSNNFSLAEMIEPVWAGVVAASDDAWKSWLRERQMPNFAWSSQARGFFTDRAGPGKFDDPELVRCWYSERNLGRRARAVELAKERGKTPVQVALAYCLAQDFPVFPLIGPLALAELDDSLGALEIALSPSEVRWLEEG